MESRGGVYVGMLWLQLAEAVFSWDHWSLVEQGSGAGVADQQDSGGTWTKEEGSIRDLAMVKRVNTERWGGGEVTHTARHKRHQQYIIFGFVTECGL